MASDGSGRRPSGMAVVGGGGSLWLYAAAIVGGGGSLQSA